MKKILSTFVIVLSCQLLAISYLNAQTGTWTKLTNNAPDLSEGGLALLTDGTVLCHNSSGGTYGTGWDKLTPDASGSYINGTWSRIASMHHDRLFFSMQVLPNGNVWVAGGEYGSGDTASEVYNPLTNIWTICSGVPSGWNIYDAPSELLYTGQVLDGPEIGTNPSHDCLFYTPSTNLITIAPSSIYSHDEAQWLKLPDSSVLFVGIGSRNSNRYIPQTNTWVTDATLPVSIYDHYGEESGCGMMLPNGKAIFFGATQHNAIYTPTGNANPGTWDSAAEFPMIGGTYVAQPDAPGAMLVNGHILLAVAPLGTSGTDEFRSPTYFLEYDYTTNTFTQVTSIIPGVGTDSVPGCASELISFLDLPDGTVLASVGQTFVSDEYWVYTPGSPAIPQGKPTINTIIPNGCQNYKITGKLFNGISEGASFGDDWQMATNYPLIRLSNGTNVYYARTTNWNRIGAIQTDSLEDTANFTVPSMPGGTYSLVAVANGFASNPVPFTVFGATVSSQTNILCNGSSTGSATSLVSGGISPYTYSWSPGGNTDTAASGLMAGTYTITVAENSGCTVTITATITQPAALAVTADSMEVTIKGGCNGGAGVNISGGSVPYTYLWTPGGLTTASITGQCAGNYCCKITDAHNCLQNVCVNVVTGINEVKGESEKLKVYPNPNNGKFTFQIDDAKLFMLTCEIQVYNVLGEEVYSQFSTLHSQLSINLSSQPDGVYLYRVIVAEDGSLLREGKLVIEK